MEKNKLVVAIINLKQEFYIMHVVGIANSDLHVYPGGQNQIKALLFANIPIIVLD